MKLFKICYLNSILCLKYIWESDDDEAENEDLIEFKKPRPKFFSKYKFNDENKSILSETSGGTSPSIISEKSDSGSETSTSHSSRYNFWKYHCSILYKEPQSNKNLFPQGKNHSY